jgi:hypothetical protein
MKKFIAAALFVATQWQPANAQAILGSIPEEFRATGARRRTPTVPSSSYSLAKRSNSSWSRWINSDCSASNLNAWLQHDAMHPGRCRRA